MRFALVLLVLVFAAAGALFGALNSDHVALDFYFAQAQLPKGAVLLFALLSGWLLGGLVVYLSLVPALRRRVRAQTRELNRLNRERASATGPDAGDAQVLVQRTRET